MMAPENIGAAGLRRIKDAFAAVGAILPPAEAARDMKPGATRWCTMPGNIDDIRKQFEGFHAPGDIQAGYGWLAITRAKRTRKARRRSWAVAETGAKTRDGRPWCIAIRIG